LHNLDGYIMVVQLVGVVVEFLVVELYQLGWDFAHNCSELESDGAQCSQRSLPGAIVE